MLARIEHKKALRSTQVSATTAYDTSGLESIFAKEKHPDKGLFTQEPTIAETTENAG